MDEKISYSEVRSRLQAAGIPAQQIEQVLAEPNPQQHLSDLPPPPAYVAASETEDVNEKSHSATRGPLEVWKLYRATPRAKKDHLSIIPPGMSNDQAAYSVDFKATKLGPDIRIYSHKNGNPIQICECVYHRHLDYGIDIRDNKPNNKWRLHWNPSVEGWRCGRFLDGAEMMWSSVDINRYPGKKAVRCKTTQKKSKNFARGELQPLEPCRVVMWEEDAVGEVGQIEFPKDVWEDADKEDWDDMVSNAMIQIYRAVMGWDKAPPARTRRSDGSGGSSGTMAVIASTSAMC